MFLVYYYIIVMLIQYCQKWSRIGQKKLGQNGGNLWAGEQSRKGKNWSSQHIYTITLITAAVLNVWLGALSFIIFFFFA